MPFPLISLTLLPTTHSFLCQVKYSVVQSRNGFYPHTQEKVYWKDMEQHRGQWESSRNGVRRQAGPQGVWAAGARSSSPGTCWDVATRSPQGTLSLNDLSKLGLSLQLPRLGQWHRTGLALVTWLALPSGHRREARLPRWPSEQTPEACAWLPSAASG